MMKGLAKPSLAEGFAQVVDGVYLERPLHVLRVGSRKNYLRHALWSERV